MASPVPAEDDEFEIDPSEPFKGIIVCCTSIPPEHRAEIAKRVAELGGVHKYDLTPDVTHLVVGDYDTPKYRHVARERPDVSAMDARWIHAVNELWKNDDHFDFRALERAHRLKPLETCGAEASSSQQDGDANTKAASARGSLLICLTGFGDQGDSIADSIRAAGGRHTGDLTKRCTHLIANRPEGKKFTAAKSWGVHTVTLDWLHQTVERGMILEEARFDPLLPAEEQGVGAWTRKGPATGALGKRSRSAASRSGAADEGTRKLRKTASIKLSSQTSHIWGDILGRPGSADKLPAAKEDRPGSQARTSPTQPNFPLVVDRKGGVFSNCVFVVHGFPQQRAAILEQTIATMGGTVAPSLSQHRTVTPDSESPRSLFLIVPQSSQPDTHPHVTDDKVHIMTEFYIEHCLHNKRFFSPHEHVLGRPFPLFPIPSFSSLVICSAAFTGIELNHVSRSVAQLGAKYDEAFRKTASVLVCKSLPAVRKEKLKLALDWGVPVVPGEWLWECISTGFLAPIDDFIYPELKSRYTRHVSSGATSTAGKSQARSSAPQNGSGTPRPPAAAGVDTTAFDDRASRRSSLPKREPITAEDFASAPPSRSGKSRSSSALSQVSSITHIKPQHVRRRSSARLTLRSPFEDSSSDAECPEAPPPSKAPAAAREAAGPSKDELDKEAVRQGLTSALSGLMSSTAQGPDASKIKIPRRRQKILGRAVSIVSDGSSAASYDAASRPLRDGGEDDDDDEDKVPPPATQLEYVDPEAEGYKAALMSKMAAGAEAARVKTKPVAPKRRR